MVAKIEEFIDGEEMLSTFWENEIKPSVHGLAVRWRSDQQRRQASQREEEREDLQRRIDRGRRETQLQEEHRQALILQLAAEKEAQVMERAAELLRKREFVAIQQDHEDRLKEWVDQVEDSTALDEALDQLVQLAGREECPTSVLEPLVHLSELLTRVIQTPLAAEGGLPLRILREGNRLFQLHFSNHLEPARLALLWAGFRPLFGRAGGETLLTLLATEDATSLRNSLLNFMKATSSDLPHLEGVVWWYLEEPKGFKDLASWLEQLKMCRDELKRRIVSMRTSLLR
eukprot:GHVH01005999.1.p1 GENE.GHVH01005999.1~~GHVH01005999.1.p1  ORF type:complete len:287 (-),score=53.72 GHVH01005999.1:64-924(-)